MSLLRFVYELLPYTDPDWDGTVTEETDNCLFTLVHLYL